MSHSEAVHVETRDADHARRGARAVRRRQGRRGPGRPGGQRVPAGRDGRRARTTCSSGRVRQDPSIEGNRGLAFWVVSDNLRKGAASNAVEIAEALLERGWVKAASRRTSAAAGSRRRIGNRRGVRGTARVTRDERRVALEAIASEVRVCTRCRLHEGRTQAVPGEGEPGHRGRVRGRGPRVQRGPRGPARSSAAPAACSSSCSARSAGSARTCSSPTSSSAGRPTTATRSPTRSRPARRTCGASSRRSTRRSSSRSAATRWARSCPAPGSGRSTGPRRRSIPRPGPRDALVFAMYHPAAALRTPALERESYADIARVPGRPRRAPASTGRREAEAPRCETDPASADRGRRARDAGHPSRPVPRRSAPRRARPPSPRAPRPTTRPS